MADADRLGLGDIWAAIHDFIRSDMSPGYPKWHDMPMETRNLYAGKHPIIF